jgi:prepilin-type processing-associated H-X9-DG protein
MKRMPLAALAAIVCAGLVHAQELPVFESSEKTSYQQVAGHLNPGGNTFVYQNAARWGTTLEASFPAVRNLVLATVAGHEQEEAQVVLQLIEAFLKDSGLKQLNGVGTSSIPIGDGLHHNRVYFGHTAGPAKGLLWEVFTQENTPLPLLKSLPADTVLATRIPLRAGPAWQWLRKAMAKIENQHFQRDLERELEQMRRDGGINLDTWLASLGDGVGLVLALAPRPEGVTEPEGRPPDAAFMDLVGRASLAVLVEVKDDTIFDGLEATFQKMNAPIKRQDAGAVRSLTVQQQLPIPGQGPLAIVRFGKYLGFVSNDRILKALSEGKGGLTDTKEFKRLAAKLPQQGIGFSFLSERLGNEVSDAMDKAMAAMRQQMGVGVDSHAGFVMQLATQLKGQGSYVVSRRTKDGVLALNTATFSLSEALIGKSLIGPAMFMGSVSGVRTEHGLEQAHAGGNRQRDMNNLKQIGVGLVMHANDFDNRFPDDLGVLMDRNYVRSPQVFVVRGSKTVPPTTAPEIRGGRCDYLYFGKGVALVGGNLAQLPVACTKPGLLRSGGLNVLYADGHCAWHQNVPPLVKALIAKARKRGVVVNKQDVNYARIRGTMLGSHLAQSHPNTRVLFLMPPMPKGGLVEALVAGLRAGLADKATVVETVTLAPPEDAKGDAWFTGQLINGKTAAFKGKVDLVVTGMGLPGQGIQTLWFWPSKVKVAIAAGDVAGLRRAIQAKLVVAAAAINPGVVPDDWQPPKNLAAAFAKRYLLITPENVQALAQKHGKLFR